MNRKRRKLAYIRIKNTWGKSIPASKIIEITTTSQHRFVHNPKHPLNMIIMDFKNRDEIIKYGVKRVSI